MSAIYSVFTSRNHPTPPKHLPTLSITPRGQPQKVLYNFIHTKFNVENFLLTPSRQGDLCIAKLVANENRTVYCDASRNLKWFITNAGVLNPVYKVSLPNPNFDGNDLPLFQISKPNPNVDFWSLFYFAYAGHQIPPKRIEFGKLHKIIKNHKTEITITITGKSQEEKAVWQTLGDGNEDAVEWVILCTIMNLIGNQIRKSPSEIPPLAPQLTPPSQTIHQRPPAPAVPIQQPNKPPTTQIHQRPPQLGPPQLGPPQIGPPQLGPLLGLFNAPPVQITPFQIQPSLNPPNVNSNNAKNYRKT